MQPAELSQCDLIAMHLQLKAALDGCEREELRPHYEHVLLGLQKLIESYGPTPLYEQWLIQLNPQNFAEKRTILIDL